MSYNYKTTRHLSNTKQGLFQNDKVIWLSFTQLDVSQGLEKKMFSLCVTEAAAVIDIWNLL